MKNASCFIEIRRKLNSRSIRAFARTLPWPYNGMVNDVLGSMQTGGNYLAALGLASYTASFGRQVCFGGDDRGDCVCYSEFVVSVGPGEILVKTLKFEGKDIFFKDAV